MFHTVIMCLSYIHNCMHVLATKSCSIKFNQNVKTYFPILYINVIESPSLNGNSFI